MFSNVRARDVVYWGLLAPSLGLRASEMLCLKGIKRRVVGQGTDVLPCPHVCVCMCVCAQACCHTYTHTHRTGYLIPPLSSCVHMCVHTSMLSHIHTHKTGYLMSSLFLCSCVCVCVCVCAVKHALARTNTQNRIPDVLPCPRVCTQACSYTYREQDI